MNDELRNYTRWTSGDRSDDHLVADMLGVPSECGVTVDRKAGAVFLGSTGPMNPDLARMIGVRLIEAAALADGDRAIRRAR